MQKNAKTNDDVNAKLATAKIRPERIKQVADTAMIQKAVIWKYNNIHINKIDYNNC